ncbi:MAG: hypothetical protein MI824_21425, partial [Hyphomicrobiales bacterium]|nr:hypothetical protein [Hyphomicrobiales bacterium]
RLIGGSRCSGADKEKDPAKSRLTEKERGEAQQTGKAQPGAIGRVGLFGPRLRPVMPLQALHARRRPHAAFRARLARLG